MFQDNWLALYVAVSSYEQKSQQQALEMVYQSRSKKQGKIKLRAVQQLQICVNWNAGGIALRDELTIGNIIKNLADRYIDEVDVQESGLRANSDKCPQELSYTKSRNTSGNNPDWKDTHEKLVLARHHWSKFKVGMILDYTNNAQHKNIRNHNKNMGKVVYKTDNYMTVQKNDQKTTISFQDFYVGSTSVVVHGQINSQDQKCGV